MSHNLDMTTGQAAIAFTGETPWHKLGTPAQSDWSIDQWIDAARIGYEVVRVPAFAAGLDGKPAEIPSTYFNRRSDTGALLGSQTFTDRRVEVQPREIVHFINDFVSVDSRFKMAVMGAIKNGAQVWATASFNGGYEIAGEAHQAYLMARTGFDGSLATHFYATMVRGVCKNTLAAGWDKRAMVTVRHNKRFDAKYAANQLAKIAQSVEQYKVMGDAMAQDEMAKEEISAFFKSILAIPAAAKPEDLTTRKQNQFADLARCYRTSVEEGAPRNSSWAALQAVTRYVDHDRTVRGGDDVSEAEKRFTSSQFGSGEAMKAQAMQLLMPRIKDKVLVTV